MSEQNKNSDPHQQPLQLWTQPPENYYRSRSSISLNNPSPADSQTPIMATSGSSWYNPHQSEPSSSTSPQPQNEEPIYPPPPPLPDYRMSMNVVNGEVGAVPAPGNNNNNANTSTEQWANVPIPPLSAALKTSATTAEEQRVAELERKAQEEDKRDLAIKLKVRLAKVVLRSINCACSLVVLALVASTFAIFNATRFLPPRLPPGGQKPLRPWSATTPTWPQITILVIACISLILSLFIMFSYWKGGHNRAEQVALHATIFAGAVFIFTIAMWSTGIGIMQASRAGNDDQDLWGWACKDNQRRKLFEDSVNYKLVCRQQDWVVVCAIIEISVEFLAICVYIFAFYRIFHTKRKLRKSLMVRDEARSSLWLAKLKQQQEAEGADAETVKNTTYNQTYNQLNANTNVSDAEEGRSEYRAVPKLQPAPMSRHKVAQSDASDAPLQPPAALFRQDTADLPPTPRSVSFQQPPGTPGIAR